jgi:hypothetical protein
MACPRSDAPRNTCPCTYPCDKKGQCCACVAYHRRQGELPACYFTPEAERTYDRSLSAYLAMKKEG